MDTTSKTVVIDSESLKQSLTRTKGYTDSALKGFEDRIKQVENDVLRIDEDLANAVNVISEDEAKAMLIEVYGGEIFNSKLPVGGLIYYINPDVTGDYKFYKEDGSEITGWSTVSDLTEAHSYEKLSDNADDKFYVIYDTIFSEYSKYKGYSNFYWVYGYDPDTGYEQVLPYQDSEKIGRGRTNTQTIMAKDDGAYIAKDVFLSIYEDYPGTTLWWVCKDANDSKLGGCNDWFIPSQYEGIELANSPLCLEYFEEVPYFLTSTEIAGSYVPYNDMDEPSPKSAPYQACALVRAF